MAKKITFKREVNVSQMVDILQREKIEHVRVTYSKDNDYIVVKNRYKNLVCAKCGDNNIFRIKNIRHYENICFNHIDDFFEP